jgi:hypothetical protein
VFIPINHQNAPLNLYLSPLSFFKKFFRSFGYARIFVNRQAKKYFDLKRAF